MNPCLCSSHQEHYPWNVSFWIFFLHAWYHIFLVCVAYLKSHFCDPFAYSTANIHVCKRITVASYWPNPTVLYLSEPAMLFSSTVPRQYKEVLLNLQMPQVTYTFALTDRAFRKQLKFYNLQAAVWTCVWRSSFLLLLPIQATYLLVEKSSK